MLGRAPTATRERRRVLIVCEDSKSSRYYFESFPVDKQRIEISVLGFGMNTDSLVGMTWLTLGMWTEFAHPAIGLWRSVRL